MSVNGFRPCRSGASSRDPLSRHRRHRVGHRSTTDIEAAADGFTGGASLTVAVVAIVDEEVPLVTDVTVDPNPVEGNTTFTVTATLDDTTTGGSGIVSAEYRIDTGEWQPMMPSDQGTYGEPYVEVTATEPDGLPAGTYNVCVRGTDAAGNASDRTCTPLQVDSTEPPEPDPQDPPASRRIQLHPRTLDDPQTLDDPGGWTVWVLTAR